MDSPDRGDRHAGDVRLLAALGALPDPVTARAQKVAAIAHLGQTDQAGRRYLEHPARVAARLAADGQSDEAVAVGWLHDVIESTALTLDDVQTMFADHPAVVAGVAAITRSTGQPRDTYYRQILADPLAVTVKWADVCDNLDADRLAVLPSALATRLRERYARAIRVLSAA